jgi:hypothetical protein
LQFCDAGREADAGARTGRGAPRRGKEDLQSHFASGGGGGNRTRIRKPSKSTKTRTYEDDPGRGGGAEEPNVPPLVQTPAAIKIPIADGLLGDALDILTP